MQPQWLLTDIIVTKGILPGDILSNIYFEESEGKVWDDDTQGNSTYRLVMKVKRWSEETDEEYLTRMQNLEKQQRAVDEREKLEYLRLKAKFEKHE